MKKLLLIIAITLGILTGCGGESGNLADKNTSKVDENTTIDINTTVDESKILLLGKTLYYMEANEARTDTYKTATFKDEIVKIKTFDLKTNDLINENDLSITYSGYSVITDIFEKDNSYKRCQIAQSNQYGLYGDGIEFKCFDGYNDMIHMMRYTKDKAIAYPTLYTSDITVQSVDITNQNNINAPKINNFIFDSNYAKENNQTATLSNRTNYDFRIMVDLNDTISGNQKVYIFFNENNASNVTSTGNHLEVTNTDKRIINIKGNLINSQLNKFQFTLNSKTVTIDDSDKFSNFPTNGYLDLFVCEDELNFNSCNYSSIPVKFKE